MTNLHLAGDKAMSLVHAMVAVRGSSQIQIRFCWAMAFCIGKGSGLLARHSDAYYSSTVLDA